LVTAFNDLPWDIGVIGLELNLAPVDVLDAVAVDVSSQTWQPTRFGEHLEALLITPCELVRPFTLADVAGTPSALV
jgi:hypothetical protein